MKPFRFKLEPLRIVRERQERDAMEKYAKTLEEQRRAVEALNLAEREYQLALDEGRNHLVSGTPVIQIVHHQLYCTHLQERIKTARSTVAAAGEKVKQAAQIMMAARQQREVVDKFRENQHADYDREAAREEQKMIDELAGRRLPPSLTWRNNNA